MVWHLTGYHIGLFFADTLPFALAAAAVMTVTHFATESIASLWLLLIARIAMAAVLYYAVMRLAHVEILNECQTFIINALRKNKN